MKTLTLAARATLIAVASAALLAPLAAQAQNIAIVNGKAVPKARLDALVAQAERGGQKVPAEQLGQVCDGTGAMVPQSGSAQGAHELARATQHLKM